MPGHKKRTVEHKAKSKTIEIDSKGGKGCGWCSRRVYFRMMWWSRRYIKMRECTGEKSY